MRKSAFESLKYTFKTLGFHYGEEALERTFSENSVCFEDMGIKFHFNDDLDDRPIRQRLSKAKLDGLSAMAHKNGNQSWLVCMDMEEFLRIFCKAYGVAPPMMMKGRKRKQKPSSVTDISAQAKAAGMSYGKYVAMLEAQNNHEEEPKCPHRKRTRSNY